jgi:hypothetical protein
MKYLNLDHSSVSPPTLFSFPSFQRFGNRVLPFEKWSKRYSMMNALSAITTGSEEPGAVTEITGDLPRAWTFWGCKVGFLIAVEDLQFVGDFQFFEEPEDALRP